MPAETTAEAVTAAWRAESARLVGALTRMTRSVQFAEDLAQDALVEALEQWPTVGVPDNPAAWLMTTARRRGIDQIRRSDTFRRKAEEIGHGMREEVEMSGLEEHVDYIEDDVLRLMFLSCHPTLTRQSRAALTLRVVGGLTTGEIARGFLVSEKTMGQRISRAKKTLVDSVAELELPTGAERVRRLDDVMAVIYLIFNEGYAATSGDAWMRPELAYEAVRLARMLADLAPGEPEVHGLQALLELQASRMQARTDVAGNPILLQDQDRGAWDRALIERGLSALRRAEEQAVRGHPVGRYYLQAAIAAEHARSSADRPARWDRIAGLYDTLAEAAPGPIVEVNRAVAHGRAYGPSAGLAIVDELAPEALGDSPLIPSVRGDLLLRSHRYAEAAEEFLEAAGLSGNAGERGVLLRRADEARAAPPQP